MCPSYMGTLDEEHSTRGRANALRTVLSGKVPKEDFTGKRLHEIMDLCLECKACKAECPSNVDMAKLKYEFLDHYHRAHGLPVRNRLFGAIARLNRIGSQFPAAANRIAGSKAVTCRPRNENESCRDRSPQTFAEICRRDFRGVVQ